MIQSKKNSVPYVTPNNTSGNHTRQPVKTVTVGKTLPR